QVENAGVLLRDGLPLLRRVALSEQPIEQLARVRFHRQRCGWRAERGGGAVGAAIGAVAGAASAAASFGGDLERREWRVLPDVRRRNLVYRDPAIRVLARPRRH